MEEPTPNEAPALEKRSTTQEASPSEGQSLSPAELRRILRSPLRKLAAIAVAAIFAFFVWFLSQTASLVQLFGPLWPIDPEIHPHETKDASSLVLPFVVTNKNALFEMKNVEFTCGVDLVWFQDAGGHSGVFRDGAFPSGKLSIPAGTPGNVPCDASQLVKVDSDGSLWLSHVLKGPSGGFRPPLKIIKMCLWIGGDYKVFGLKKSFTSIIFQWPAMRGSSQWIEGPIAGDPPLDEQIPGWFPNALQCHAAPLTPFVFFKGDQALLIFNR